MLPTVIGSSFPVSKAKVFPAPENLHVQRSEAESGIFCMQSRYFTIGLKWLMLQEKGRSTYVNQQPICVSEKQTRNHCSPLEKKVLTMKLKKMEEMEKIARKVNTNVGSLFVSTAPWSLTCKIHIGCIKPTYTWAHHPNTKCTNPKDAEPTSGQRGGEEWFPSSSRGGTRPACAACLLSQLQQRRNKTCLCAAHHNLLVLPIASHG